MSRALLVAAALFGALGCNQVLGLDERTFDPCVTYCETVQNACTQAFAEYQDDASCEGLCRALPPGEADNPVGNTVACRVEVAKKAAADPGLHCPAAGPSGFDGAGTQVCGDRCATYCDLMKSVCKGKSTVADLDTESCVSLCLSVPDNPSYDPTNADIKDHDDSIQCRLWHLAVATTSPDPHCAHADGSTKCDGVFSSTTSSTTGTGP